MGIIERSIERSSRTAVVEEGLVEEVVLGQSLSEKCANYVRDLSESSGERRKFASTG